MTKCRFSGCGRGVYALELCKAHYLQQWRGRPLTAIPSKDPETRYWSKVDKSDPEGCWLWTAGRVRGYGRFFFRGVDTYAHRISYELANGPMPEGLLVDHMCHVKHCVNPAHLRLATTKQNMENRSPMGDKNNTSGYRNVSWNTGNGRWRAIVKNNGSSVFGGYFDCKEEANKVAIELRNKLFTHSQEVA